MAKSLQVRGAIVTSDNKHLITLCVSKLVPPWEHEVIVQHIKALVAVLYCSFFFILMGANEAAHWVASAKLDSSRLNCVACVPVELARCHAAGAQQAPPIPITTLM